MACDIHSDMHTKLTGLPKAKHPQLQQILSAIVSVIIFSLFVHSKVLSFLIKFYNSTIILEIAPNINSRSDVSSNEPQILEDNVVTEPIYKIIAAIFVLLHKI